jgi:hypothetical protein
MFRTCLFVVGGLSPLACGGPLPHPPFAPQLTDALVIVASPPPPGRVERVPDRPSGADAWVEGEWIQHAGRWSWLLGRWVKTPNGARYSPWVVVRAADGTTYYAPSAWKNAQGLPLADPPALSFAAVTDQAVYDPQGEIDDTGRAMKEAPIRHVAGPEH